jgi:hypothetical protein
MIGNRPSAEARIHAAIALEETDRAALGHSIDSFAARYAGITQQAWWFDHEAADKALRKTFEELGPWDTCVSFAPGHPLVFALSAPMRVRLPGRDLPPDTPMQFEEQAFMTADDYDRIVERGFDAFLDGFLPRVGIDPAEVPAAREAVARHAAEDTATWKMRGVHALCSTKLRLPFDWFSYARSLNPFMIDLFRKPEPLIAAMDATLPTMLDATLRLLDGSPRAGVFLPMARGAATFISPPQFERFCLPWLLHAVEALVEAGHVPVLHCDADWTPRLEQLRACPPKACILQLDEQTDIRQAKAILGDHMCLYGNVPPALLALGSPAEVQEHCEALIRDVGAGGGFILGPACTMPTDAKPENVRAMTDAVLRRS